MQNVMYSYDQDYVCIWTEYMAMYVYTRESLDAYIRKAVGYSALSKKKK